MKATVLMRSGEQLEIDVADPEDAIAVHRELTPSQRPFAWLHKKSFKATLMAVCDDGVLYRETL